MNNNAAMLVIGAGGLVGSHLVRANPERTIPITRNSTKKLESHVIRDVSTLVFLAQSSAYTVPLFVTDLLAVNVELLRRTLHAVAGTVPKVILFSTGSVYKASGSELTEDSPVDVDTTIPYVASKLASEFIAQSFAGFFESISIVRPFFIYGSGQRKTMLFSKLQADLLAGESLAVGQDGGIVFNPVHVSDVVRFIELLHESPLPGLNKVNLYGPESTTLEGVINHMADILNVPANLVRDERPLNMMVAKSKHVFFQSYCGIRKGILEMLSKHGA
ncbi:MAG: NAD(P)-dependent oxidoreductase [Pseudomonadota bacterium]